jgi:hypothetical protein
MHLYFWHIYMRLLELESAIVTQTSLVCHGTALLAYSRATVVVIVVEGTLTNNTQFLIWTALNLQHLLY